MEAQEFTKLLPDYILNRLTIAEMQAFEDHLSSHPEAIHEVDEWKRLQEIMNVEMPEPSSQMDTNFYAALHSQQENDKQAQSSWLDTMRSFFGIGSWQQAGARLAFGLGLLLIGLFLGNTFGDSETVIGMDESAFAKAEEVEKETQEIRSQLVMALADQPSASKRLQAVSESNKMSNANEQVIAALFKMLNSDSNVNVRLAAVTSLSKYVDNPKVREGLVMSITKQESPLVQIALAELMVTLKEQKSINSMETLLQQPDINDAVKLKLEESIKRII